MSSYPRPIAQTPQIEKVRHLYRTRYGVTLSFDEAKTLLEQVMHFIYLTELDHALRPVWEKKQRK